MHYRIGECVLGRDETVASDKESWNLKCTFVWKQWKLQQQHTLSLSLLFSYRDRFCNKGASFCELQVQPVVARWLCRTPLICIKRKRHDTWSSVNANLYVSKVEEKTYRCNGDWKVNNDKYNIFSFFALLICTYTYTNKKLVIWNRLVGASNGGKIAKMEKVWLEWGHTQRTCTRNWNDSIALFTQSFISFSSSLTIFLTNLIKLRHYPLPVFSRCRLWSFP